MYGCIIWMNDLSERSDLCEGAVRLLAQLGEARVVVAYAMGTGLAQSVELTEREQQMVDEASAHLTVRAKALEREGIDASVQIVQARPADAPGLLAYEFEGDLVVVGPTGVSGLDRLILGSTSGRIVRDAPTPVLVCKSPLERVERILCPVASDSYVSDSGIAHAMRLARATGAAATFLGVVKPTFLDRAGARDRLVEHVEGELGGPLPEGWDVRIELEDKPVKGILAVAGEADLVVMSSSERKGIERWLLGSVAEEVVSACPVPVLVAR